MTRNLKILSFALFTWGIGEAFFIYTQTLYMESLGADALAIGAILALAALGMTLTHIPAGALADRIGSQRIIRVNWVFSLAAATLMYLAKGLTIFTIGLVLYQFTGFVLSPLSAYISSARGKWSASRALTTTYAMFSIGGFIGSSLGWVMGDQLSLQAGYGLAMITFVISTASIFLLKNQPVEIQRTSGNFTILRKRPDFRRFLFLSALILFSAYLSWPLTPNYLHDIRSVSTDMIRLFGALYSLGTAILSLLIGRFESHRGLLVTQILMAASISMLWLGGVAPSVRGRLFPRRGVPSQPCAPDVSRGGHGLTRKQRVGLRHPGDSQRVDAHLGSSRGRFSLSDFPFSALSCKLRSDRMHIDHHPGFIYEAGTSVTTLLTVCPSVPGG